jgi:hypothetical protein
LGGVLALTPAGEATDGFRELTWWHIEAKGILFIK